MTDEYKEVRGNVLDDAKNALVGAFRKIDNFLSPTPEEQARIEQQNIVIKKDYSEATYGNVFDDAKGYLRGTFQAAEQGLSDLSAKFKASPQSETSQPSRQAPKP
jgi:hypothetical protein